MAEISRSTKGRPLRRHRNFRLTNWHLIGYFYTYRRPVRRHRNFSVFCVLTAAAKIFACSNILSPNLVYHRQWRNGDRVRQALLFKYYINFVYFAEILTLPITKFYNIITEKCYKFKFRLELVLKLNVDILLSTGFSEL